MIDNNTFDGPGPGAYESIQEKNSRPYSRPSNNFITKVPRFCPTAPGSTVYKPPTFI